MCQADLSAALAFNAIALWTASVVVFAVLSAAFWVWKSIRPKVRLIHDMRFANTFFPAPPHFSLPTIREALRPRDGLLPAFTASIDIASAYWHVPLCAIIVPFFLFRVSWQAGVTYVFQVLPFGWAWSPYVFICVLAPCLLTATASGVWLTSYMDDILILGSSHASCAASWAFTIFLLTSFGWAVNMAKCSPPSRVNRFLGMVITCVPNRVYASWPTDKAAKVRGLTEAILRRGTASPRDLSRISGRVAFVRVVAPILGFIQRPIDAAMGPGTSTARRPISPAVRDALMSLLTWLPLISSRRWLLHTSAGHRIHIRVDASDTGFGARASVNGGPFIRMPPGLLPMWLRAESSASREQYASIVAVVWALRVVLPQDNVPAIIDVVTDNSSVAPMWCRGRTTPDLADPRHSMCATLLSIDRDFIISVVRVPRMFLAAEDSDSRVAVSDPDSVGIADKASFAAEFGPRRRDLFASSANRLADVFFSVLPEPEAAGVDGLRATPTDGDHMFPPPALAGRAMRSVALAMMARRAWCPDVTLVAFREDFTAASADPAWPVVWRIAPYRHGLTGSFPSADRLVVGRPHCPGCTCSPTC